MKKVNNSQKNVNKMSTKSVSKISKKTKQSVVSAISDWALNTISSSLPKDQLENIREVFESKQGDLQKILSSSIKESFVKKLKDPDAPKRGKSSYIFFCLENREKIKKSNPDMSAKDIIKELGRLWRDLSVDKKEKYIKMSQNDKERYSGEINEYTPSENYANDKKRTKKDGPKRSLTSYIFFCKEYRTLLKEQQPNLSTKEITSELGKRWKTLTDDQKIPYNDLADEDKTRYDSEKTSWTVPKNSSDDDKFSTKTSEKNTDISVSKLRKSKKSKSLKEKHSKEKHSKEKEKSKKSGKSKSLKEKKSKKSSKNPVGNNSGGYILFCKEERDALKEENPDFSSQQLTKELGKAWNDLSQDEQEEYNERAQE